MFVLSENEGCAGYLGDLARAGGDVLEGAPALGEQGECPFAEAAQGSLEGVRGAGAQVGFRPVRWLFYRDADADSGTFVSGVGQGWQAAGGSGRGRGCGPR